MIRTGIIGCGKIADQHVEQIHKIPGCEIVAVCDSEILMGKQLAERSNVKNYFSDVKEMISVSKPDVIHITTPPQGHYSLGKLCLESGCNVYIEKPFTVDYKEAKELIDIAIKNNLKLTVGHNMQYTHIAMEMRKLVANGYLGGNPVHMESIYCYNLGDEGYAKALLGDSQHWVRSLPGQLLQNIISHGIAKIAEFIKTDDPTVIAHGFTSSLLKKINENEIIDELRVIIDDGEQTTAYFTFTTQVNPPLHQFRLFGPKNSLLLDDDQLTIVKLRNLSHKSFLKFFLSPRYLAKEYKYNSTNNIKRFLRRDLHMNTGMKNLIEAFYKSISNNEPLPISYKEILITAKIMDEIFYQIKPDWKKIN
jgi:predicted dehydrogenase